MSKEITLNQMKKQMKTLESVKEMHVSNGCSRINCNVCPFSLSSPINVNGFETKCAGAAFMEFMNKVKKYQENP